MLHFTVPAIIASYTISSICVVYNVDEVYQGVQLLKASETRDTDAEIDRLVDFHNEALNKVYVTIGGLSTAYCGTLVMGTFIGKISGVQTLSFKSAVIETGEDLMTDQIAGCIDETLGEANPLKRMIINLAIGGGTNLAKSKISAGKVTNNLDAIDATDAKNVVKNVDVTDAKNVIKNADITDAKNVIKDIDAVDVKNAVKNVDAIDIKTATNVKESVVEIQQGHIRTEIKADTPTALDVADGDTMPKVNSIESVSRVKLNYVTSNGLVLETTPNKTTTVLGTYKSDTSAILDELGNVKSLDFGARDGGFNLLNTPDELYVSPNQFWNEYNKPWLDNAIARGDIIKMATEPTWDNLTRINMFTGKIELTGFGREYTYLRKHGYSYDNITKTMSK